MKRFAFPAITALFVLAFAILSISCGGGGGNTLPGDPDTETPTVPPSLAATPLSSSQISVAWSAASDNVGVTGYKVYRGGTFLQSTTKLVLSVLDSGLNSSTEYCYQVSAYDAAGNESTKTGQECAITLSGGATIPLPGADFLMPDTNQTQSYTDSPGEDHDYAINAPSYTDNSDGTVTDNITGLIWQQQGDGSAKTWEDAITYCSNLNLGNMTGWHLPTRIELVSIVDYGKSGPAIDTTAFPGTSPSTYWSSTTLALYTVQAWYINFDLGTTFYFTKTYAYGLARCVHN